MISVTKQFEFCYAHYLPGYQGKCRRMHGHNAILEVTFSGGPPVGFEYNDMIIDFGKIKEYVDPILEQLDHRLLNELPPWDTTSPICENLIVWIADQISKSRAGHLLQEIRLSETPKCWATWRREDK